MGHWNLGCINKKYHCHLKHWILHCFDNGIFYWCIPASLATDGEFIGTWSKLESPIQRDKTSTRRAGRNLFWRWKNTMLFLVVFIKT
jgi:hypothetical protein